MFVYVYEHESQVPLAQIEVSNGLAHTQGRQSTVRYYHTDQFGVPHELTDRDGKVQWRARYHAWGNTRSVMSDDVDHLRAGGSLVHQPLRLMGHYFDHETGLHNDQYRYYDPDAGRFMTQASSGLADGGNPYQYRPREAGVPI